jgi:hypothetical protein
MAQEFRRFTSNAVGTSPANIFTADSYDTVVGIHIANTTLNMVLATVVINDGSNDITLINAAPIAAGGALQVLDGGAKFVVESGDILKITSDTAASLDCWVSVVDAISA